MAVAVTIALVAIAVIVTVLTAVIVVVVTAIVIAIVEGDLGTYVLLYTIHIAYDYMIIAVLL
jgi:hypothetical protein